MCSPHHHQLRIAAAWVLGMMLLVLGCSGESHETSRVTPPTPISLSTPLPTPTSIVDTPAFQRGAEIARRVMKDESYLTSEIYSEFWSMLGVTNITASQLDQLRETVSGVGVIYQRYFFQDGLQAIRTSQPIKSPERERYEKTL